MSVEQTMRDAEFCEAVAAEYRIGLENKAVAAACEIHAQRYDRLAAYARKAVKTPQRELIEKRESVKQLGRRLQEIDTIAASYMALGPCEDASKEAARAMQAILKLCRMP